MTIATDTQELPTSGQIMPVVLPHVPLMFQVHFEDREPVWGMAQPTTKPEYGRSILMIGVEGFGWWYPDKSLEESVRRLFRTGSVSEVKVASIVMAEETDVGPLEVLSVEWTDEGTTKIEVAGTVQPVGAGDTATYHRFK